MNRWVARTLAALFLIICLLLLYNLQRTLERMVDRNSTAAATR